MASSETSELNCVGYLASPSNFWKKGARTPFKFPNSFAYSSRTSCSNGEIVSALVFVEDEGVNSGAEVEGVEAMVCKTILSC